MSLTPQDKCPPPTAVVLAVTLRRRRRGESRGGNAVTGIKTRAKARAYAPNGRSTRLAPVVWFARAGELGRWVKNTDDKRQALTNGMAAVGNQAAEDTRASRIIDPHDTGPPAPRPVRGSRRLRQCGRPTRAFRRPRGGRGDAGEDTRARRTIDPHATRTAGHCGRCASTRAESSTDSGFSSTLSG